jgi:DNA modification methylase
MIEPVIIGNATLYCGDCLEILPHLGMVDAVITDPPYNIPTQAAACREVTRTIGDLSMIEASFRLFFDRTLKLTGDTGRHFVFGDGISYPVIFRAMYGRSSTALLVWDKGRIGMGREFRKRHELIMHAWNVNTPVVSSEGTGFSDILQFKPLGANEREHPAQKPVDLIEALLRVCGGTICDPFMGSASTGVACIQKGKKFVGIEIEPKYFDIACKRIEQAQAQQRLFA